MGPSSKRRMLSSLIVPFAVLIVVPLVTLLLTSPASRGWAQDPPLRAIVSLFGLTPLLVLTTAVVILHLFYIPLSEEQGLEKRFGEAYREYKRNVPRWIPRLSPWEPNSQEQDCEQ